MLAQHSNQKNQHSDQKSSTYEFFREQRDNEKSTDRQKRCDTMTEIAMTSSATSAPSLPVTETSESQQGSS